MLKKLIEKRAAKVAEMDELLKAAREEVRSFNEDEKEKFDALEAEINQLDVDISIEQRAAALAAAAAAEKVAKERDDDEAVDEIRALAEYIRTGHVEERALTYAENGVLVAKRVSNQIIEKIRETFPIFDQLDVIHANGELTFPVNDDNLGITANYVDEMTDVVATATKFKDVTLYGHVVGAAAKLSKKMINNTDFNVVNYVVKEVGVAIGLMMERAVVAGDAKVTGIANATDVETVTTAAATKIATDELIDLQNAIVRPMAENAGWLMNRKTLGVLRKLKDNDGRYLLQNDATAPFGYMILGRPIFVSENMPDIAGGKIAVAYADFKGIALKMSTGVEIQVLKEHFAMQHSIGVVGFVEFDAKILNPQSIAVLKQKAGA